MQVLVSLSCEKTKRFDNAICAPNVDIEERIFCLVKCCVEVGFYVRSEASLVIENQFALFLVTDASILTCVAVDGFLDYSGALFFFLARLIGSVTASSVEKS